MTSLTPSLTPQTDAEPQAQAAEFDTRLGAASRRADDRPDASECGGKQWVKHSLPRRLCAGGGLVRSVQTGCVDLGQPPSPLQEQRPTFGKSTSVAGQTLIGALPPLVCCEVSMRI